MTRFTVTIIALLIYSASCSSQQTAELAPTRQDTLRGSITSERAWWNADHYAITVEPDFNNKSLTGSNIISFTAVSEGKTMQIDLQQPMEIKSAKYNNLDVDFNRTGNAYFLSFNEVLAKGTKGKLLLTFGGVPREAVNPPWDGGWIWKRDSYGNPWMSVACQGLGASVWYPCKDHQSDEPDSASLTIICADTLVAVGNGRLHSVQKMNNKKSYRWQVVNPINNYNIVPYIGKYVQWSEKFNGEKGTLDINYWVLQENAERAKKQFTQVPTMLRCFEHWFGPYPFYEDGFKLVESPHLGMEHQSAIAYGNGYQNGYLGKDLSGTGWGKKWDFIIVHESGHEWFGNNITTKDIADMWVHEGFTNYSEVLFTTCEYGIKAGNEYLLGLRKNIQNDKPLITKYGINREGSVDMYYKGSNLVHTIRQIIDDDEKFRNLLRGMNQEYFHQTVSSSEIEKYISSKVGRDLSKVFDQYLRTTQVPKFEYRIIKGRLKYRWTETVKGFDLPLRVTGEKKHWLYPTTEWQEIPWSDNHLTVDPNFYIDSKHL